VLKSLFPSFCLFFLQFLPPCNIFMLLCLFFAIGSIHQEAQVVKFNCSCTSGFISSQASIVFYQSQVQLLAAITDFSGFNCLLPFFKFNYNFISGILRLKLFLWFLNYFQVQRLVFRSFYLVINI
jgi:hypothetical protein